VYNEPTFDLAQAQSILLTYLGTLFSKKLLKTDHVHTSEFLTQAQKDILLNERQVLNSEYQVFITNINSAISRQDLNNIKQSILNW